MRAIDRQTKFSVNPYLNPVKMTIPQYNFRLGYYLNDHWNVSLGIDHMKYVMVQRQVVTMNGWIGGDHTYTGTYGRTISAAQQRLPGFEHTDGLNDLNLELRIQQCVGRMATSDAPAYRRWWRRSADSQNKYNAVGHGTI